MRYQPPELVPMEVLRANFLQAMSRVDTPLGWQENAALKERIALLESCLRDAGAALGATTTKVTALRKEIHDLRNELQVERGRRELAEMDALEEHG